MNQYALAWLPTNGCIYLAEHLPIRWESDWRRVFHRESRLSAFAGVVTFDTLEQAKQSLTDDDEHFVMQFNDDGSGAGCWFRQEQIDKGIPDRLNRWRGCYGTWPRYKMNELVAV